MSSKYGDTNSPNSRLPGRPGRDDPQQRGNQQNIPPPKNEEELENAAEKALKSMETTHRQMLVLRQKVIVVGEYASGKTALVNMFTSGGHNFPKNYVMTLGCEFAVKMVDIPNSNVQVEQYIFDTSGQKVYNQRQMLQKYWTNASACCLVYDVSNRDSFLALGQWLNEIKATRRGSSLPGVLVANKCDLRSSGRQVVGSDEGREFAQNHGLQFFETSPLRGIDVEKPFNALADNFYKKYESSVQQVKDMVA